MAQDKTISECSYSCGFNNVTYFNRMFKNIPTKRHPNLSGVTPVIIRMQKAVFNTLETAFYNIFIVISNGFYLPESQ